MELKKEYFTKFQIDLTNRCNAKCIFCPRTNFVKMEKMKDLDFDVFKKIFDKEYIKNIKQILYNGNLGEPTLSKEIFKITKYIKENNYNLFIWVSSNGSTHTPSWWSEFAKNISYNRKNMVRFGIDGLEDTHHLYRGTNYKKILKNMEAFIKAGGKAEWQFLLFEYNEHQIEKAKKLAEDMGCFSFILLNSRFYNNSEYKKPKSREVKTKTELCIENNKNELYCSMIHMKSLYLDHNGRIFPCCDYGLFDTFYGKEKYPAKMYIEYLKSLEKLDMHKSSIDEAVKTPFFKYVIKNMDNLIRCKISCKIYRNNSNENLSEVYQFWKDNT